MISLDYHETLCAGAGQQAEAFKDQSIKQNWGKYVLVVDGSIPTRDGGVYCMIGGRPILEVVKETAEGAAAIIAIGSCASWGGIPSSDPNPTQARPVHEILPGKTVINIPGCPPNSTTSCPPSSISSPSASRPSSTTRTGRSSPTAG